MPVELIGGRQVVEDEGTAQPVVRPVPARAERRAAVDGAVVVDHEQVPAREHDAAHVGLEREATVVVKWITLTADAICAADGSKAGEGGYKSIRIPSVIVTRAGTVLAFAEGRAARNDQAENDIILKRSADKGPDTAQKEFDLGKFHFNYDHRSISDGGHSSKLSPKEADLLRLLYASCLYNEFESQDDPRFPAEAGD